MCVTLTWVAKSNAMRLKVQFSLPFMGTPGHTIRDTASVSVSRYSTARTRTESRGQRPTSLFCDNNRIPATPRVLFISIRYLVNWGIMGFSRTQLHKHTYRSHLVQLQQKNDLKCFRFSTNFTIFSHTYICYIYWT